MNAADRRRLCFNPPPERGLRGIPEQRRRPRLAQRFNPPRSAGSGESTTRARTRRRGCCFNPPRSAGSGESCRAVWALDRLIGFQSAPERGLRGIRRQHCPPLAYDVSIRPGARAPGNLCFRHVGEVVQGVSIRPGARAPGNLQLVNEPRTNTEFQSAPERGLRGIIAKLGSAPALFVSIRPGARAPGNPGLEPAISLPCSFNPPRSAGSGESALAFAAFESNRFQSAPERGLRGILKNEGVFGEEWFQSAPERGLRGIFPALAGR